MLTVDFHYVKQDCLLSVFADSHILTFTVCHSFKPRYGFCEPSVENKNQVDEIL
jgi:hypothetical protein